MYMIDNEKFGAFIAEVRKEKNLTQRELGERLFVSDKTVSKWERGLSIPNVTMLMPIAEVLGITVTELLRGERIEAEQKLDNDEVENLVTGSLDLTLRREVKKNKRNWIIGFFSCVVIVLIEIFALKQTGMKLIEMQDDIFIISGIMLLLAGWFCFFAKDVLPAYYDKNKVDCYSQGPVRIHLSGLSINNSNWPYICKALKLWSLVVSVLYPLICLIIRELAGVAAWNKANFVFMFGSLLGMMIVVYAVGLKYAKHLKCK